ncbi:hypothetical protein HS7_19090 [Sulfolobales archaeon HS-7]|nr:hypothetical protein HS7_19090 [Sulfolobales archaeon HS-7]
MSKIVCPYCGNEIDANETLSKEVKKEFHADLNILKLGSVGGQYSTKEKRKTGNKPSVFKCLKCGKKFILLKVAEDGKRIQYNRLYSKGSKESKKILRKLTEYGLCGRDLDQNAYIEHLVAEVIPVASPLAWLKNIGRKVTHIHIFLDYHDNQGQKHRVLIDTILDNNTFEKEVKGVILID